jgi:hypothetical protein
MLAELLQPTGKKKVVERRMRVNCHVCGVSISCPAEADVWAWLKCGDVIDFFAAHRPHGGERAVGAEIETVVKEE